MLDVALHVGTLLAVLVYYRREVFELCQGLWPGGSAEARRKVGWILAASVPTAFLGLALKRLGVGSLGALPVAGGLLVTALVDYSTTRTRGGEATLDMRRAALIGVVQGLAVLPGVSRSGSTIAAGMALGLPPLEAARFSFLCSIPAVAGAALLTFKDYMEAPDPNFAAGPVTLGVALSFLVGLGCLRFLMRQLQEGTFRIWAGYCLVLALLVFGAHFGTQGGAP